MILLDGGSDYSGYADAVTTHCHGDCLAALVQHPGVHGFTVFGSQLKDMTHLDAPANLQGTRATGAGIPGHDLAYVGSLEFDHIPLPVDPA